MGGEDHAKKHEEIASAPTMIDAATGEVGLSRPNTVLAGRYEIEALLGTGGMGAVYRARDAELDEVVALKMLRRQLITAPGMLARFKQEVKLARRVTHRNVARTFDIGDHAGDKFLTMELVDGESLSARLARERVMSLASVVRIARELCAGLAAAHAAGVVHRDLKPDNVLLAKDGRVVITDFGIARALFEGAAKTMGAPVGTPAYMAPEQVEGKELDGRADVYALGAILYELLTGERAWGGESVYQVAAMRLVAPPPDPREKRRDLPEPAARIVVRCMARNRDDRFATIEEVDAALDALTLTAGATSASLPAPSRAPALPVALTPTGALKSLALLPLRNAGPPDDEYLADTLTDDIIDTLSMCRGLRVRGRGAVVRFKDADRDARAIGRELEVQVVADGALRRVGETVRVSVRLVSVEDGFQIWAKRFDRPVAEVLSAGEEVSAAIRDALTVTGALPARDAPSDAQALDLYLRGRHEFLKGWREDNNRAIALFEAALARAPDDSQILSALAMALARRFSYDERAEDAAEQAMALAERALAIAPKSALARAALARVHLAFGDVVRSAGELRAALQSGPTSADSMELLGRTLGECDRVDEGISALTTAIALEPERVAAKYEIARLRALTGDHDEADALFAVLPEDAHANVYWMTRWRVVLWRRDAKTAQDLSPIMESAPFGMRQQGMAMFRMIMTGELMPQAIAELDARGSEGRAKRRRAFFRQMKAELLAFAGDTGGALTAIEDAADAKLFDVAWLDRCPLFDAMRAEPRFVAARARVASLAGEVLDALGVRR